MKRRKVGNNTRKQILTFFGASACGVSVDTMIEIPKTPSFREKEENEMVESTKIPIPCENMDDSLCRCLWVRVSVARQMSHQGETSWECQEHPE